MTRSIWPKPKNKQQAKFIKELRDKTNKALREERKERRRKALEVPREIRQAFIDYIHEGMTFGDAYKKAGIEEFEIAREIFKMNTIKRTWYELRKTVV